MAATLKPFVHWAIYKGFKVRYTQRTSTQVHGVLTTPDGEIVFEYDPNALHIHLPEEQIFINQHGWELPQDAQETSTQ